MVDLLVQDLRYAVRSLLNSPLLTAAALVSLALGIGANAAIFSAVDVFMFRPLDYERPDRLVNVWTSDPRRGWPTGPSSMADVRDWRRESATLDLAPWTPAGANLEEGDRPERLDGVRVGPDFFRVMRIRPLLGRVPTAEDQDRGTPVLMIGEGLWERRFGRDPALVGGVLSLDGMPYEVVGVMPRDFRWTAAAPDLFLPFSPAALDAERGQRSLQVVGRMRDDVTAEAARQELAAVQRRLEARYPETNAGRETTLMTLREAWYGEGFTEGSLISTVAVAFVLLIACANVANLLLVRAAGREKELALRESLGARRGRILRQLLTESLLLALAGGLAGLGVAAVGVRGIQTLFPPFLPSIEHVRLTGRVLAFTGGVTLLAALAFGLLPSLRASRPDLKNVLVEAGRGGDARGGRLRRWLVGAEVAMSIVLLVSSFLLVQAFVRVRTADLGFRTDDLVTARLTLPEARYPAPEARVGFQRRLLAELAAIPGVESVGGADILPMQGGATAPYEVPDQPPDGSDRLTMVAVRRVTPGFFDAMGIRIAEGRPLLADDDAGSRPVAVVSDRLADLHWPAGDALGRTIRVDGADYEIVGVAGGTRDGGPEEEPTRMVYLPLFRIPTFSFAVAVHTALAPEALVPAVREAVLRLDPDQPVYRITTMREVVRDWMSGYMAMVKIMAVLGGVAFVLSAVGVYGVLAYSVSQRTREMGVRMALGADRDRVRRLVVGQGVLLVAAGAGVGLAVALATTRLLAFFLMGMSPYHPAPYVAVTTLLLITGLAASWIPAVRATRVDPSVALKAD